MTLEHSSQKELPLATLLAHLEKGWRASSPDVVRDFVNRWHQNIAASVEIVEIWDNLLHFTADVGQIRFRGTDEIHILAVSGTAAGPQGTLGDMWRKINSAARLIVVLALSQEAFQLASVLIPLRRVVLLGRDEVAGILNAPVPLENFKWHIREQIPRRRLVPFNIKNSISDHMFFGRIRQLARLRDEEDVSFAVAGPSRIGKTSLLLRYRKQLSETRDPRMHCTFFIDFSDCIDRSANGIARHIALRIDNSSVSNRLTSNRLGQFFHFWREHFGRPVELLLDECDEIFYPYVLHHLGLAAKQHDQQQQLCRLIFAGKGVVLRAMQGKESPLACRIDLLQLEPLRAEEAKKLLLDPFMDLGFQISEPEEVFLRVQKLSGNFPHSIQYFGSRLVELLLSRETEVLQPDYVQEVSESNEAMAFFLMNPFQDLTDPKSRLVALALIANGQQRMRLPKIQEVLAKKGVRLDSQQLLDISLDLTINNILCLDGGAFRVANESLGLYAKRAGFLEGAWREARAALAGTKGR